jgi:hypothetical protein
MPGGVFETVRARDGEPGAYRDVLVAISKAPPGIRLRDEWVSQSRGVEPTACVFS